MKMSVKTRSSEVSARTGEGQKFDAILGPMVARSDLGMRDKAEEVVSVVRLLPERALQLPQDL